MEANKRSLGEILSSDIRLVAPLFQRPYVWDRENNWEHLWSAMNELFERRLGDREIRPYFLGAVVLDKLRGATGTVTSREIIDGQQRMITLQVLMQVAKEELQELGQGNAVALLDRVTMNILGGDTDDRFKVWPTNIDRDQYRDVMMGNPAIGRIQEIAEFYRPAFMKWLDPDSDGMEQRAKIFAASVTSDLVFVVIDLDLDDDGQLIFETLNSLGTPLLPSDLVKNLLFREAIQGNNDTDNLYERYWKPFEEDNDYWRGKVKIGRRERNRIDVFLQHYLTYRLATEPNVAHLFRDYRDAYRDGKLGDVESALSDFAELSQLYEEFDEAESGASGSLRHVLHVLDISVLNPLILGINHKAASSDDRDELLRILESYVVRRFLCGKTTKNYNRMAVDLINTMEKRGWVPILLQAVLQASDARTAIWPDDDAVLKHTLEKPAYGNIRRAGIGYVLGRVEADLRDGSTEVPWNTRTPLTLEHIMPQKWEDHWPLSDPGDMETEMAREDALHRMGNLTVLTRKLNSEVSHSPWVTKRAHFNEHSVLLINNALASLEDWDEKSIEKRGTYLSQKFCDIWPR